MTNFTFDSKEVQCALRVLFPSGQVTELRALNATTKAISDSHTASGFFDQVDNLVHALSSIESAKGIYIVPNPVDPGLLARAKNCIKKAVKGHSTSDSDVTRRHWLLIDADPRRPSGVSSTDAEHGAALELVQLIKACLNDLGWPAPVVADSGNGAHLLYRVDLPVHDDRLVERTLAAIAKAGDNEMIKIDTSVHNPARIWKLYGTRACKGNPTKERPHRMSRILSAPESIQVVERALMEALVADMESNSRNPDNGQAFDIDQFIARHGFKVDGPNNWQQGRIWVLMRSPMCEHHDGAAFIAQFPSGALVARCHHDSCDWGWAALRDKFEPRQTNTTLAKNSNERTVDRLVELALNRYRIGRTDADEAFAVELNGPNVALMFRGSRDALRSALARDYRSIYKRTPGGTALADALTALQGEAYTAELETVHLRVAEHGTNIVIDLADSTGRAVIVEPGSWLVVERSPVLFRRTAATGALPLPTRGGDLAELQEMLNVSAKTWPLVLGWLVAALVPNIPHPILMLGGQQGTGKSTAAKQLVGMIDPSPAPLRSQPRDADTWAVSASASWVNAIDNVSVIPDWWSDSLCKAVTGDGWLRRRLFTDGDLALISFRRVIMLTSIDPGALRGDLGDRVLLVDLEPIDEAARLTEREIDEQYRTVQPRLFGALLDLLAKVWSELPAVHLKSLPRMADFGRLLAAIDRVTTDGSGDRCDNRSLDIYLGQRSRIAEAVVESDPVAMAIQALLDKAPIWQGTAWELLEKITPGKPCHGWPGTPQAIGARLKRLIPAFNQLGIAVSYPARSGKRRLLTLARIEPQTNVTNVTSTTPQRIKEISRDNEVSNIGRQRPAGRSFTANGLPLKER